YVQTQGVRNNLNPLNKHMLKKDDIILIKSYGNEKTKIFLRGVNEVLMIDASFEEVKFAINNDLQDLQGMQAVSAPLKIAT
ncbi:hypothetical protein ACLEKL_004678, partial [Enterobacter hormaechei]